MWQKKNENRKKMDRLGKAKPCFRNEKRMEEKGRDTSTEHTKLRYKLLNHNLV